MKWAADYNAQCIICRQVMKTFKTRPNGEMHASLLVLNRHFRLGLHYRTPRGVSEHVQPGHIPSSRARMKVNLCTCLPGQRLWP